MFDKRFANQRQNRLTRVMTALNKNIGTIKIRFRKSIPKIN